MRTALVLSLDTPDPTTPRTLSFDYGFPRTAVLIATCIQEWGQEHGFRPVIVNADVEIQREWGESPLPADLEDVLAKAITGPVRNNEPDFICIVAPYTSIANWASKAAKVCRSAKPDAVIITGGPHASFRVEELVGGSHPLFDAVIVGAGEAKLKHILENFDSLEKRFRFQGIATPTNLSGFSSIVLRETVKSPPIDFDLISSGQIGSCGAVVMAGRGCPGDCDFCLEPFYWKKSTSSCFVNATRVRGEISSLESRGVPVFGIGDSLIDIRRTKSGRFDNFCEEAINGLSLHEHFYLLTRLDMVDSWGCEIFKRSGGKAIWMGIETASETLRSKMGKTASPGFLETQLSVVKESGLRVGAFFMFGYPGETPERADATLKLIEYLFAQELLDYVDPSVFVPYPGLSFYTNRDIVHPKMPEWEDWDNWGRYGVAPVYSLDTMSSEDIFMYWLEAMKIKLNNDIREIAH